MQNYKGSLIVFGETLLTLGSFKFRKSHDIVMKFYLHKNWIIKNRRMSAILIKHFYSVAMNIFVEVLSKKMCGKFKLFFIIKPKLKQFWRIVDTPFFIPLQTRQNFTKTKFQTKLIWFKTGGVPKSLNGIAKLAILQ